MERAKVFFSPGRLKADVSIDIKVDQITDVGAQVYTDLYSMGKSFKNSTILDFVQPQVYMCEGGSGYVD